MCFLILNIYAIATCSHLSLSLRHQSAMGESVQPTEGEKNAEGRAEAARTAVEDLRGG